MRTKDAEWLTKEAFDDAFIEVDTLVLKLDEMEQEFIALLKELEEK